MLKTMNLHLHFEISSEKKAFYFAQEVLPRVMTVVPDLSHQSQAFLNFNLKILIPLTQAGVGSISHNSRPFYHQFSGSSVLGSLERMILDLQMIRLHTLCWNICFNHQMIVTL